MFRRTNQFSVILTKDSLAIVGFINGLQMFVAEMASALLNRQTMTRNHPFDMPLFRIFNKRSLFYNEPLSK